MTYNHFLAISLLFLTPAAAQILVSTSGLKRRFGLNMADLALPLFAYEIVLVSRKFFIHSFLPHYAAAMSVLAIFLTLFLLKKSRNFSFRRWFKFFWRSGFILTALFYLGTILAIFTLAK